MAYIGNKDLGYDKNYVFTVSFPEEATKNTDAIENELLLQKGILKCSFSSTRDITNVTEISGDIILGWKKRILFRFSFGVYKQDKTSYLL